MGDPEENEELKSFRLAWKYDLENRFADAVGLYNQALVLEQEGKISEGWLL